jgi:hypothetical protein
VDAGVAFEAHTDQILHRVAPTLAASELVVEVGDAVLTAVQAHLAHVTGPCFDVRAYLDELAHVRQTAF